MPDHEEVVREAYDEWRGSQSGPPSPRRSFEAGAASERAKYAALVEAANRVESAWMLGSEDEIADAVSLLMEGIAALQSKEGTNE